MSEDDRPKPFDVPLENDPGSQPFGSPVIDFGGVRIAHGMRRYLHRRCEHKQLIYSRDERRIWCEECERTIEAFDAFMTVADHFHKMQRAANAELARATEASKAHLVRRAAKELDRVWGRKMAASCPHCKKGILPEDGLGRMSSISREMELARRKRDGH